MKFPALPPRSIIALELNVPHAIHMPPASSLVTLTLVDANHCPGAVVLHARWCATEQCVPSSLAFSRCSSQLVVGRYRVLRRLQGQRQHVQVLGRGRRACNHITQFTHLDSELAALPPARVVVLDTTFAHHSWNFEPQVMWLHFAVACVIDACAAACCCSAGRPCQRGWAAGGPCDGHVSSLSHYVASPLHARVYACACECSIMHMHAFVAANKRVHVGP